MIRFGLRLAVAGVNAVDAQNARHAWLNTGLAPSTVDADGPLWWMVRQDRYDGRPILQIDLATATADGAGDAPACAA